MTRDIRDRLDLICGHEINFTMERIALNYDQVEEYNPPPNPAKITDSRASRYIEEFGRSSWELDALEPTVMEQLIEDRVLYYKDMGEWMEAEEEEEKHKKLLNDLAINWREYID